MISYSNLNQQCNNIKSELENKKENLKEHDNENLETVNSKLQSLRQNENKILQSSGFSIAKDMRTNLDTIFQEYDAPRQKTYNTLNSDINKELGSLETAVKNVASILNKLTNIQKEIISTIEDAKTIAEVQQKVSSMQPLFEDPRLNIRITNGTLAGLKLDVDQIDIDNSYVANAALAQSCKTEIAKQESIVHALKLLAEIQELKNSTDEFDKIKLMNTTDELTAWSNKHKELVNQHLIFDEKTKQNTSINNILNQIINSSQLNKENITTAPKLNSPDDYLKNQQSIIVEAKKSKLDYNRQQNYSTLILYFKEYQKSLTGDSKRAQSIASVIKWITAERDNPNILLKDTLADMEKRKDYQSIVKSKIDLTKIRNAIDTTSPERELRNKISEFKNRISNEKRTSNNVAPSSVASTITPSSQQGKRTSTHAQVLKTMPPQNGNRPSASSESEVDFDQIFKDLQEAAKPLPSQQPQPQPQPAKEEPEANTTLGPRKKS